mmetsp:Transcript_31950/g.71955  ORF Transcript_31950/g.71955 Transcript_31950/m.71955 type:complete len:412 (-) Transcript_31950:496-1731(-)
MMAAFVAKSAKTKDAIFCHSRMRRLQSIEKPTVMKKSPKSKPRKGTMSDSIWYRYLVSERRTPARKAPRVLLSPRPSVSTDMPTTVSRISDKKASWDLDLETKKKIRSSTNLPMRPMALRAMTLLIKAARRALPIPASLPARRGIPTSNGTTARSWKSKMPKEARPCLVAISSLSLRICRAKAELERASPAPITTRAAGEIPGKNTSLKMAVTAVHNTICAAPSPKTSLRIETRRSRESSMPISKRKKTIPNSAMCPSTTVSWISPKPEGPMAQPVARNPRMGLRPKVLKSGITVAVHRSSVSTSNRRPDTSCLSSAMASLTSAATSLSVPAMDEAESGTAGGATVASTARPRPTEPSSGLASDDSAAVKRRGAAGANTEEEEEEEESPAAELAEVWTLRNTSTKACPGSA